MITWSSFCHYMKDNKHSAPATVWHEVARMGWERRKERLQRECASEAGGYGDLVDIMEQAIAPK